MTKNTFITLLAFLAIGSIGYAVYRSVAVRITSVAANGQQTVFGEPQHGLLLGLCIFAGICIYAIARLYNVPDPLVRRDDKTEVRRTTLS